MKVYLETPTESRGIKRVYHALIKYAPKEIEVVKRRQEADLEVLHIIGRNRGNRKKIKQAKTNNRRYAMIQYCLKSTMNPDVSDWIDMWNESDLVWSYYDLPFISMNEGYDAEFPFYYAPLGVDTEVFKDRKASKRDFVIATSGKHALTESTREAILASKSLGMKVFHMGHDLRRGKDVVCIDDMSDRGLSQFYSRCEYVSGLRRTEGFEFPVIEGLMCGARPIVFDRPHYRNWYDEFAIFIPEDDREGVEESLRIIFKNSIGLRPITEEEKDIVRRRFNWEKIITNFWNKLL